MLKPSNDLRPSGPVWFTHEIFVRTTSFRWPLLVMMWSGATPYTTRVSRKSLPHDPSRVGPRSERGQTAQRAV